MEKLIFGLPLSGNLFCPNATLLEGGLFCPTAALVAGDFFCSTVALVAGGLFCPIAALMDGDLVCCNGVATCAVDGWAASMVNRLAVASKLHFKND